MFLAEFIEWFRFLIIKLSVGEKYDKWQVLIKKKSIGIAGNGTTLSKTCDYHRAALCLLWKERVKKTIRQKERVIKQSDVLEDIA